MQTPFPVAVTNTLQRSYLPPAQTGFTPFLSPHTTQVYNPLFSGLAQTATSASPTAVMYGNNQPNTQQGMNFNIMGANKPRKLESLTHQTIKKFKSEFAVYHHETNGQATLLGHIADDIVTVIDSLLGAREDYAELLCHGDRGMQYISEEQRALRPWLHRSEHHCWK